MGEEQDQQQPDIQPDKPKKKFYKKWWFWIIIIFVLVALWLLWVWFALGNDAEVLTDESGQLNNSTDNIINTDTLNVNNISTTNNNSEIYISIKGDVTTYESPVLAYWEGQCPEIKLSENSISNIICGNNYCLMQAECIGNHSRLIKFTGEDFIDISDQLPEDRTNRLFYSAIGDNWLISDGFKLFSYDGQKITEIDLSNLAFDCKQIRDIKSDSVDWFVGVRYYCDTETSVVKVSGQDNNLKDETALRDFDITKMSFNGNEWLIGGYINTLVPVGDTNHTKSVPHLLIYSKDFQLTKDISEGVNELINDSIQSLYWNRTNWMIALKHTADNEDGIIYKYDGNEFKNIEEAGIDYDKKDIRLIGGVDDSYVILSGDQTSHNSKLRIIKDDKIISTPDVIGKDIYSAYIWKEDILVGGLHKLFKINI